MKISKLFHWLYASVMFLPLVIIPLFGIWTINHDHNEPISVVVAENELRDFNQLVSINDIAVSNSNYSIGDVSFDGGYFTFTTNSSASPYNWLTGFNKIYIKSQHVYYTRVHYDTNLSISYMTARYNNNISALTTFNVSSSYYWQRFTGFADTDLRYLMYVNRGSSQQYTFSIELFDLTQMYGVGNEPSNSDFLIDYPDSYYSYTKSDKRLIKNVGTITYDDTDIGSQFLYTLYNSTEKYLNFDEVLNLGAISDWINENVFNGNAPLVFYIVWHYLDYWLILSIFWLCFDVLIYVPNIAHRWLDKASLE